MKKSNLRDNNFMTFVDAFRQTHFISRQRTTHEMHCQKLVL